MTLMPHRTIEYASSCLHEQAMATHISSISQALAGNIEAVNIPKPTALDNIYYDKKVGNGDQAGPTSKSANAGDLLTPPNSISPTLPEAFRNKFGAPGSPPSVDSDIDLQDATDQFNDKSEEEGDNADTGHITPQYLAKNHIASYILAKGPIAVRHVMNYLGETVPGYNKIPAPKARRITVAALESKAGGGPNGDVEFEKVGWGRWDAKQKGQPSREARAMYSIREDKTSPPPHGATGQYPAEALQIPGGSRDRRRSKSRRLSYGSWAGDSHLALSMRGEQQDEDFGDVMSIDGDEEGLRQTYRPTQPQKFPNPELSSDTEEEDWSTLGAGSYREVLATSGPGRLSRVTSGSVTGRSRSRGWSPYPSSVPTPRHHLNNYKRQNKPDLSQLDFKGMDLQEQEAVTALLKMGSM